LDQAPPSLDAHITTRPGWRRRGRVYGFCLPLGKGATMNVSIYSIPLGVTRCYVIRGQGAIAIDAGTPNQAEKFKRAFDGLPVKPSEIGLLVLTHAHTDHIGSAMQIRDTTGAQIALHASERDWLEHPAAHVPPGVTPWGRIMSGLLALAPVSRQILPAPVDIALGDEDFPLAEYGIPGRILYTPGHSRGSTTVLLETGDAFVGDLAMNAFPLRFGPGLPVLAEDMEQVRASWRKVLAAGAVTIYPAHGKPFPAEVMRNILAKV